MKLLEVSLHCLDESSVGGMGVVKEIKNYIYGKPREVLDIAKPYVHSGGFHCPWWGFRIVHSGNRWDPLDGPVGPPDGPVGPPGWTPWVDRPLGGPVGPPGWTGGTPWVDRWDPLGRPVGSPGWTGGTPWADRWDPLGGPVGQNFDTN